MICKSIVKFPVRYYECDQMGIVHHSNYVRFCEVGRCDMMGKGGLPIGEFEKKLHIMMPVVSVELHYKHSAKVDDVLTVVSMIEKDPLAKVEVLTEIYNQEKVLLCTAKILLGFIKSDTRKPTRCPEAFHDAIRKVGLDV